MHLYPEDTQGSLIADFRSPDLRAATIREALQGAYAALECHAKIMRTMYGRNGYKGDCFTRHSFLADAEKTEAQMRVLSLLMNTLDADAGLSEGIVSRCQGLSSAPRTSGFQAGTGLWGEGAGTGMKAP